MISHPGHGRLQRLATVHVRYGLLIYITDSSTIHRCKVYLPHGRDVARIFTVGVEEA